MPLHLVCNYLTPLWILSHKIYYAQWNKTTILINEAESADECCRAEYNRNTFFFQFALLNNGLFTT